MTGPAYRSTSSPTDSVMSFSNLEQAMSRSSSGLTSPPQRIRSRTQSISSDRPSTIGHGLMSPPLSVSPEAAFIAASAASQIVTNDHDSHADTWYDQHGVEPSGETALVSPAALQLVNNFLDQLLFNFLSIARSTTLSALRPAVSEVLKPKLAKDAINQADEELREYLGGGDDEDAASGQDPQSARDWDLELIWKRTRLRCMVYSSLGDMEEEDEDYYMEQEHFDADLDDRLSDVVPAAVAIFLTSILEFMGEAALVVAGQAAYHRMRVKYEKDLKEGARSPADVADRIVVEELDMERVALDRTLGRLWRAWKKKIRSPVPISESGLSRPHTRDSMRGANGQHLRQASFTFNSETGVPPTVREPEPGVELESEKPTPTEDAPPEPPVEEYELAASIPLPMSENDIDEIEVPGLAWYDDEDEEVDNLAVTESRQTRPKSLMILPHTIPADLPTPTSQPHTPVFAPRKRSNSLPTPAVTPYASPPRKAALEAIATNLVAEIESPEKEDAMEIEIEDVSPVNEIVEEGQATTSDVASPASMARPLDVSQAYHKRNLSAESAVVSRAAAVELTAVAGLGSAPEPTVEAYDNEEDDAEDLVEMPQVFTSSRISISGRSASPATSEHRRPSPINANLPARSLSIHSLRLIDVTSPRSPTARSRGSSVDATELIRSANASRTNSASTTPVVGEYATHLEPAPGIRASTLLAQTESISEAEELREEVKVSPVIPETEPEDNSSTPIAKHRSPARYEEMASDLKASQPIFGSSVRRQTPPTSPQKPATTKVTILTSSAPNSGTFFLDDNKPEVPEKSPLPVRAAAPVSPSVPPRNPGRQGSDAASPSTIGIVSVESRTRSASEARQLHTSGSSTSSGNNRMKAVRTSEEGTPVSKADVARNFEQLIQSDQTIQYTLTPESMRDEPLNGSPLIPVKSRKSEDTYKAGERSRSSSVNQTNGIKRSTSISRSQGLSSHPVAADAVSVASRATGPVPRSTPAIPPKTRANAPQARDARLPRESVADLADFIRSTGPAGEPANPGNAFSRAAGQSAVRNASGPIPVSKASMDSSRLSTSTAQRRQARDAAVDYKDDNSDLIDFIRRGPPNGAAESPRIPRTVAPFRTTMDSDQLSGAVGGRAVDAKIRDINDIRSSQASTTVTDYSMPSVQSSINSQTGLLRNKYTPGQSASAATSPRGYGAAAVTGADDDMPMPKRKTRRVRDPYAIDISDEEEDLSDRESTPKAVLSSNRRIQKSREPKEESLADFLRNYAPPPEPAAPVQPFSAAQAQMANRPKKKASAPSLMARFTGRRDSSGATPPVSPRAPPQQPPAYQYQSTTSASSRPEYTRSVASRAGSTMSNGSRHIPIQVNMPPGVDKYSPSPYIPSNPSRPSASSSGGRVLMKKYEPRDAVSGPGRSATSDLADFLKNSAPPPSADVYAAPAVERSGDGGKNGGFFGRRKKTSFA